MRIPILISLLTLIPILSGPFPHEHEHHCHGRDDEDYEGLLEGIELTLDVLIKTLEKVGIEEVEAAGKPFDPNLHEAISQQRDDHVAPGHVSIELQKGYVLNGRLIRPSMVVISQGNDEIK